MHLIGRSSRSALFSDAPSGAFPRRRDLGIVRAKDIRALQKCWMPACAGMNSLGLAWLDAIVTEQNEMTLAVPDLDQVVRDIAEEMGARPDRGEVATYIPELGCVDPNAFGIAVIDADGRIACGGDCNTPFSIQSVSKVFTLTLALGKFGNLLWRRVGREPSGSAFNSIVQLEFERGIPRNPFINAGAIAVTDLILAGHQPREALGEILRFMQFLADDPSIFIDEAVAASEQRTGFRNAALANYMKSFGVLENPVDLTLGVYFHQCAIAMSCIQLAKAGRFLAQSGRNPVDRHGWSSRQSGRAASTR